MANKEQERKTENQPMTLGEQVAAVTAKVDMVITELQQQREDMRRLQDRQDEDRRKHDADMKELREDIKQAQARHDAEIKSALSHIQGLTIAAMVGIVAIAGATWAFMWSSTRNSTPPPNPPAQTAQVIQNHSE